MSTPICVGGQVNSFLFDYSILMKEIPVGSYLGIVAGIGMLPLGINTSPPILWVYLWPICDNCKIKWLKLHSSCNTLVAKLVAEQQCEFESQTQQKELNFKN